MSVVLNHTSLGQWLRQRTLESLSRVRDSKKGSPSALNGLLDCWAPFVKAADPVWDELKVYDQAIAHCGDWVKRLFKWIPTADGYKAWVQRARSQLTSAKTKTAYLALSLYQSGPEQPRPCPASYKDNEKPHATVSTNDTLSPVEEYLQSLEVTPDEDDFQSLESSEDIEPIHSLEDNQEGKTGSPLDHFISCWEEQTEKHCTGRELERFDDAVKNCEKEAKDFYNWASKKKGFKEFSGYSRHAIGISLVS